MNFVLQCFSTNLWLNLKETVKRDGVGKHWNDMDDDVWFVNNKKGQDEETFIDLFAVAGLWVFLVLVFTV